MAKKKVGKVNRALYIDADLDARMKKASDVNWSAIGSTAFEVELQRLSRRNVQMTVVERLRQSMNQAVQDDYSDGQAVGRSWAEQSADFRELRRLANLQRDCGMNFVHVLRSEGGARVVACAILGDEEADVREFWNGIATADADDADWIQGFADGALEVWDEVASQL